MIGAATTPVPTPEIDGVECVFTELMDHIGAAIDAHPRSQQVEIGPSQLGNPCSRALLHALNGDKWPRGEGFRDGWTATIGTAVHSWLEAQFNPLPRYVTEMTVPVGRVGGKPITGHVDLLDLATGTVTDWKVLGPASLTAHAAAPGPQYITQLQLYAHGVAALGLPVRQVLLVLLPRTGSLADRRWWADDYRPDIARQALQRAEGLAALLATQPIEQAKAAFPLCQQAFCDPCIRDKNARKPIPSMAELIAGRKEQR